MVAIFFIWRNTKLNQISKQDEGEKREDHVLFFWLRGQKRKGEKRVNATLFSPLKSQLFFALPFTSFPPLSS
jgi:hypothetical protein